MLVRLKMLVNKPDPEDRIQGLIDLIYTVMLMFGRVFSKSIFGKWLQLLSMQSHIMKITNI